MQADGQDRKVWYVGLVEIYETSLWENWLRKTYTIIIIDYSQHYSHVIALIKQRSGFATSI